jgi:hypothetical protein
MPFIFVIYTYIHIQQITILYHEKGGLTTLRPSGQILKPSPTFNRKPLISYPYKTPAGSFLAGLRQNFQTKTESLGHYIFILAIFIHKKSKAKNATKRTKYRETEIFIINTQKPLKKANSKHHIQT